jgi:hypothetical protein
VTAGHWSRWSRPTRPPEASGSHDREQGLGISVEMTEIVTDARLTLGGSE